jgi:hypothetical protein
LDNTKSPVCGQTRPDHPKADNRRDVRQSEARREISSRLSTAGPPLFDKSLFLILRGWIPHATEN